MRVFLASDHAGFALKALLLEYVASLGHETEDLGAFEMIPTDDYPDFIAPLAKMVASTPGSCGITLGSSGQGEGMVANRIPGVRAAVFYGGNMELVRKTREHNDANILTLGAHFLSEVEAKEAVQLFLSTPFSGDERHVRRIAKF